MCFFTWLPTFCCMMASSEIQYQERRKHSTNFSWHPRSQIASCIMVNGDCSFQELKVTFPIFPSLNLPLKRQEVYCMSASYILTPFRHFFHNYIIFKKIFGVISHQLQSKWSEWKPPVPNQSECKRGILLFPTVLLSPFSPWYTICHKWTYRLIGCV